MSKQEPEQPVQKVEDALNICTGKLTQARKLLEEENSAIRQDVDLVDTD
uniref:Exodeoxyribonuclease VII n=1 Tax=Meloidogyne hapla TaxID=6305 RepID=A0A1I8BF37_MELHA